MYGLERQLRDIHGLDAPGWWPLAPGWWLVFAVAVVALALVWWLRRHRDRSGGVWRQQARARLRLLRRQVGTRDPKETAGELSELLRIIAVTRFGRRSCAGLTRDAWLTWLGDHDPAGFDWPARGKLLLQLPYAPAGGSADAQQLRELIDAAIRWTDRGDLPVAKALGEGSGAPTKPGVARV